MSKHKSVGKWLGLFFFLHPLLIIAPRFLQSWNDGLNSVIAAVTSPQLLTGVIAWCVMLLWVLMAIFKHRLPLRYETWRVAHLLGFIGILLLATLHITQVGSHGQFAALFNVLWWSLCGLAIAVVAYNYGIKKYRMKRMPFALTDVARVSSRDWQLTLRAPKQRKFAFEAGQFVWINTSATAFNVSEHPFSIASCPQDLPDIAMIVRELGDFTGSLAQLQVGQAVFVDGPYGSISLADSKHCESILLIAGGAGIGPMLGLLRELAAQREQRPVRLIYGNQQYGQMVAQSEIRALERSMADFRQFLACVEPAPTSECYQGVIDKDCIAQATSGLAMCQTGVYLCGPEAMIDAVIGTLKHSGVPVNKLFFEKLSF